MQFAKIKKFEFNNQTYQLYGTKGNSISYLIRDMIQEYAHNTGVSFEELKEKISSKVWLSPYLDEIISTTVPKHPEHFFMSEKDKIQLSNGNIYVAKFFHPNDVIEIAKLLGSEIKVLA